MAVYDESGLRVTLPDGQHFRFSALASYRPLSGRSLKEMDFAWLHDGRLVMLEVKDFRVTTQPLVGDHFVPKKGQPEPHRFSELTNKITDSLLMLLSGWADTVWGHTLRIDLPPAARQPLPLVVVVGLELPATLKVHIPTLRDALNARLRGRLALADVRAVAVLDYDTLLGQNLFSPYVVRSRSA